jgi:formylglycine-generating enzyme required for sulfatase activity
VPFWRLEQVEFLPPATPEPQQIAEPAEADPITQAHWRGQPAKAPECPPLNPWPSLLRRLREVAERGEQRAVDVAEVVARLSRGQFLARLPRQRRRRWGAGLQIIQDRSQRLVPYWRDQDRVYEALRRLYPRHGFELARVHEGVPEPVYADRPRRRYRPPPSGARVLVLGDLGCLDQGGGSLAFWEAVGRRIRHDGNRPIALLPCPPERWAADIQADWSLIGWERASAPAPGGERVDIDGRARRLLRLVSPAVRIEPGFLRAVRLLLGAEADAATESDAWQHPAITSMSSVAASLDPSELASLRREFEREPEALREAVLKLLRLWRAGVPAEVWFEELIGLDPGSRGLLEPRDLDDAERYFERLEGELRRGATPGERAAGARRWFRRVRNRLPDASAAWRAQRLGQSLRRLWELTHEGGSPPPGFDPSEIPAAPTLAEERWRLDQCGAEVWVSPAHRAGVEEPARRGSALCTVRSRNGWIRLSPEGRDDFWQSGVAPAWAVDWGQDALGVFAAFEYRGVRQRLRWIAPGRFRMGSPDHEAGRWEDEGPEHEVTLSRGFWLFDTPCTQALWEAVMGDNPSRFRSAQRPVENVSWRDVQRFLGKLNGLLAGLDLTLPTEAQWEYACRAGTGTATYAGDLKIWGANDAPLLDAIAWYGGNSGVGFDLNDGWDSSDWPDKQYKHELAGTHRVARKAPNPWGLYDMLGNVCEWCLEGRRVYDGGAVLDPIGPTEPGAVQVIRGGSWFSNARLVRCAYRDWVDPGDRIDYLGFRCARIQPGAEPARDSLRGEVVVVVRVQTSPGAGSDVARVTVPEAAGFLVATDRERLRFRSITRPFWASAIGRDRFGLWVEFEVPGKKGELISQRLRWVPPGRFWMGSPESEVERAGGEGPRHEVTLSRGFWLGDTACTQALWEAVMGKKPEPFRGSRAAGGAGELRGRAGISGRG